MSDNEADLASQDENHMTEEVVKVILTMDFSKKPMKQSDIISSLSIKPGRKAWKSVLSRAILQLKHLGMELVETESSSKSFILVSRKETLPSLYQYATKEELADRCLLVLVLAYIFMKEGIVKEEALLYHLSELKILREESQDHVFFGPVKKKVFGDFVDQLYLSVVKSKTDDSNEVRWGQRAELEVSKRVILDFVCKVGLGGKVKPQNLVSHYEKAEAEVQTGENQGLSESQEAIDVD